MIYKASLRGHSGPGGTVDANPGYSLGGMREVRPVPYQIQKIAPIQTVDRATPELDIYLFN